ncbi:hypothetical protein [Streptomyces sp. NPDC059016]|uniref:hypothetical protein n=1 Tax=Streptomyces sp. NPDC059016 TaxID=3346699 RepID=UPI0036BE1A7F
MDRVYMNRRPGEERIHVELEADEVRDLLAEIDARPTQGEATRRLADVLRDAARRLPAAS